MRPRIHPQWTEEHLAYLRENYPTMTAAAIAKALGRTYDSVAQEAVKRGLRKPKKDQKARILRTIAESTSPIGLSCQEIMAIVGLTSSTQVTWALMALREAGQIFRVGGLCGRHSRYVHTPERLATAEPDFAQWRQERRKESIREKRAREREKYRAEQAGPPKMRKKHVVTKTNKSRLTPRLRAWMADDTTPHGVSLDDAAKALGSERKPVERSVAELMRHGQAFVVGVVPFKRYYSSAEKRDAGRTAYADWLHVARGALKLSQKPKPKPRKKQKAGADMVVKRGSSVDASVQLKSKPSRAAWSEQEAIIPRGVSVVVCPPCPPDRRWYVEPSSVPVVPVQQWGKV